MTRRKNEQGGIPDWEKKLEVCRRLLEAYSYSELAEIVVGSGEFAYQVYDNFRKWHEHIPTKKKGPGQFFDLLVGALECVSKVTGPMLVHADIGQFIEYLPEDKRKLAREIVADMESPESEAEPAPRLPRAAAAAAAAQSTSLNAIWIHRTAPLETITNGLRAGKIDQKHYYLDPDAAHAWGRLVLAEAYPTYDQCKAALKVLCDSEEWKQSLRKAEPSTVVMLAGGGAPSKDLLLLRNLLGQPYITDRVHYCLVDISPWMLMDSDEWIAQYLPTLGLSGRVTTKLIHEDVLHLSADERDRFHEHGSVIFGITGGTIGNFSEVAFFRSLDRVAAEGDLLIVSADTIDGLPPGSFEENVLGKYDNPDLRRFIKPVVAAALGESNLHESVSNALDRIKVSLRPGGDVNASDVQRSLSVIVTLDIRGREVTLVTSTRYDSAQLIAFAGGFGWHAVCQTPSPLNPHYKQLLFRRNKSETTGTRPLR